MSDVQVNVVGGSRIARELFSFALSEVGIGITDGVDAPDVSVLIADQGDAAKLLAETPTRRTVLVTDAGITDAEIVDLVLEGADGVISLDANATYLAETVRTVAEGGSVLTPSVTRRLSELARTNRTNHHNERTTLTNRELDILLSIGRGESVKQTAQALGISAKTVENLQSRLFRKLDVRNRAQAFAQAHAMGLLPPEVDAELQTSYEDH